MSASLSAQSRTGYDIAKASFLFSPYPFEEGARIFMEVLKKLPVIEQEYRNSGMGWSSGLEYNF